VTSFEYMGLMWGISEPMWVRRGAAGYKGYMYGAIISKGFRTDRCPPGTQIWVGILSVNYKIYLLN
jgi:hypothetical protein